jgi:hypothetical protein
VELGIRASWQLGARLSVDELDESTDHHDPKISGLVDCELIAVHRALSSGVYAWSAI